MTPAKLDTDASLNSARLAAPPSLERLEWDASRLAQTYNGVVGCRAATSRCQTTSTPYLKPSWAMERERRELKKSIFALRARSHLVLNEKKQKSKI
jgi:hypothetical protein